MKSRIKIINSDEGSEEYIVTVDDKEVGRTWYDMGHQQVMFYFNYYNHLYKLDDYDSIKLFVDSVIRLG